MPLAAGTRLGHFEILNPIGSGGMGEVYRARDERLGREVAIKTLPAELAKDARLRLRLEREARAISALNHPHICALYDIGSDNGIDYLVMEMLYGETLSERLRKSALPLDTILNIGIEIADALEKAHRNGIVHRDLKPGNVMITKSGAKLLDFGLAKSFVASSDTPTQKRIDIDRLTNDGAVVGTLDFMSPEQLQAGDVDARSDIFALGNVLYVMASGHSPFQANSNAGVIAAILHSNPTPLRTYRSDLPSSFARLVESCLAKDPNERVQSAHDVKLQLATIQASLNEPANHLEVRSRSWQTTVLWSALAAIVTAAFVGYLFLRARDAPTHLQRLSIELPAPALPMEAGNHEFAIAPDGSFLVVSLNLGRARQLYMRSFDRFDIVPIAGTEDGVAPFFSPDSRWLGFAASGKLKKLLLNGGTPVTICDAPRSRGATWASDGTIIFAPMSEGDGLYRVSADGGQPVRFTALRKGEESHRWPRFLPGERQVLFTIDDWAGDYSRKRIAVADLRSGAIKIIINGGTDPHYVGGHLVFARERTLYAQRFDLNRLEISGLPIPVLESVVTHAGMGSAQADVSADGTLVYLPYDAIAMQRELAWVDRSGVGQPVTALRQPYEAPRLSPDNRQILVTVGEPRSGDLWILDVVSKSWSRIAPEAKSLYPLWSRDGRRIFFTSNRSGHYNIYAMRSDATGAATRLTESMHWPFPRTVSPDGRIVLGEEQHPITSYNIWAYRTDGGGATAVLEAPWDELEPDFSPNGRWFAYTSSESGRTRIYVQTFPPSGRKWVVSGDGAREARWSPDGSEIFFRVGRKMMVAPVRAGSTLAFGPPAQLFEGDYAIDYDVAADGKHFLIMRDDVRRWESPALAVVLRWDGDVVNRVHNRK